MRTVGNRRATGYRRSGVLLVVLALLAGIASCSSTSTATAEPSSLRLLGPGSVVNAVRTKNSPVLVQASVSVSSPDHDVELQLKRKDATSALSVSRPDGVGTGKSTPLPAGLIDFGGIHRFAHYSVTGPNDTKVLDADLSWCPANPRTQVGPGRSNLAYPDSCNSSPFASAVVWGIEQGWASVAPLAFNLDGPDGTYRVSVTVVSAVAEALGFANDARTVTFDVALRTDPTATTTPTPVSDTPNASPLESATDHPRPDPGLGQVTPPVDTLPDLRPLPAYGISAAVDNSTDLLDFVASVWNAGAPFIVEGYRRDAAETMDAVQLFYRGGLLVASRPIGTFEYHAGGGHDHWHFLDFVRYDLVNDSGQVVATSGKQAWCLANTTAVDLLTPGTNLRPGSTALNTACGPESARFLRESLLTGWGDTYSQAVSGQALDISSVANGHYQLVITTNPAGRFLEVSPGPETSRRALDLGGPAGARTVVVPPIDGVSA